MPRSNRAERPGIRSAAIMAVVIGAVLGAQATRAHGAEGAEDTLRVCADPNNLPFSNVRGIRNTLNAGPCDVIMGVPPLDVIATTRP